MKSDYQLRRIVPKIPLHLHNGHLSHIVQYRYRESLLSTQGARASAGRFHLKGRAPALYFADTPLTAIYEVDRAVDLGGVAVGGLAAPGIILSVECECTNVLDLTDPGTQDALGTTAQELTGSWMIESPSPTQRLGMVAHELGTIVAIKSPSAARIGAVNLIVFKDRMLEFDGKMSIHDPYRWLTEPAVSMPKGKRPKRHD